MDTKKVQQIISTFHFQQDKRQPPDGQRRGRFHSGWNEAAHQQAYSEEVLLSLTWQNLGYRFGLYFSEANEVDKESVYQACAVLYNSKGPAFRVNPPSADRYQQAFAEIRPQMTDLQVKILRAHYQSPDFVTTSVAIHNSLNLNSFQVVNHAYGQLATVMADRLGMHIPDGWIRLNAILSADERAPHPWTLHPEVVEALDRLAWFDRDREPVEALLDELSSDSPKLTMKKHEVMSRVGQGSFRRKLLQNDPKCAVTQCAISQMLIASHIKPWKASSNQERLDPYNGLLLIPNLDFLFDKGFISFADSGEIMISSQLSESEQTRLGVHERMKIHVRQGNRPYLDYHRKYVFKSK